ncbi:UNVERIFIED_CONTAM: L-type lectin-domain containing receptor kinase IX.1 [Sesamum radiatum]|uniref:non-specific serine/threonine protein kinase n=1 Tax=Sesamum radiatum TaxID=300843 RepID=A0AAW2VNS6_SESRA
MATFCYAPGNVLISIFLFFLIPFSHSVNFQLSRFTPDVTTILLEGDAVTSLGAIQFNDVGFLCRVGQVIYNGKVPLWDSNSGKLADFTTHFAFIIDTLNNAKYGHGVAFFLAPVGFQIPPNSAGGFLGLFNTSTRDQPQTQIVSVEFDSFANPEWDPGYEHVGININSLNSSVTAPWNVTLHSGDTADAWITYNSTTRNLSVFWSYGGGANSSLSYPINLKDVLPEYVTVGISAATGMNLEQHTLESWEFSSNLEIAESKRKIGLILGLTLSGCVLAAGVIVVFVVWRKWRHGVRKRNTPEGVTLTSINDDLERGAGPRRFSYKDLAFATNNFSDDRKLGEGGFGGVYKGHLIELDRPIAVKKFSRRSKQGKKQLVSRPWRILACVRVHAKRQPGSSPVWQKNPLGWSVRYKIALGLASALLYLHEEWEQCVVHRDIKSSNVMLDSSFNVKLGDFGLARLMDHELGQQITGMAGTLGYMAPEYVTTGRASKESDVYSFGVVALEIATGRKSMDLQSEKSLVQWVWDLYGDGQLLVAVDEKLGMDYNPEQVKCLMLVGLWCAHPDHTMRPSIRLASHVLNFEAAPNFQQKCQRPRIMHQEYFHP